MRIKKDDTVLIITGKDRGKKGKVLHLFSKENKVSVEGINLLKKHISPKEQQQQKGKKKTGQVVEFPAPVSISNVKILCTKCNKPTRVLKEKDKRTCKKCNKKI